jgi:hypothetical protein
MMDIELLNPTFCGLNFSITGSMRTGIFIKEILDKETAEGQMKLNSSDQLRIGYSFTFQFFFFFLMIDFLSNR